MDEKSNEHDFGRHKQEGKSLNKRHSIKTKSCSKILKKTNSFAFMFSIIIL